MLKTHLRRSFMRRHAIMVSAEISYQGQGRKEVAIGAMSYNKLLVVKIGGNLYGTFHHDSPDPSRRGYYHVDVTKLLPADMLDVRSEFDEPTLMSLFDSLPEVSGFELTARGYFPGSLEELVSSPQLDLELVG